MHLRKAVRYLYQVFLWHCQSVIAVINVWKEGISAKLQKLIQKSDSSNMAAQGLATKPVGLLKLLFLIHLILSAWSMQGSSVFSSTPSSYVYYNIIYMVSIIWALASTQGLDSISSAIFINISTIILDAITLSLYWPRVGVTGRVFFGFAIANCVLRPVTGILLYQIFKDRDTEGVGFSGVFANLVGASGGPGNGGNGNSSSGGGNSAGGRQGYQSLDGNNKPTSPTPAGAGATTAKKYQV